MSFYCKLPMFGYCHVAVSKIEVLRSWEDFLLHWSILELNFNIGILPKRLITLSWWVASSEKINTSSRIFSVSRVMILTTTANSIWAPLWLKDPCNKCIDWIAHFQTEQISNCTPPLRWIQSQSRNADWFFACVCVIQLQAYYTSSLRR